VAAKPQNDDGKLSTHTRGNAVGRVRPVTLEEEDSRDSLFRPDAVLALTGAVPADVSPFEAHIAALIDGVRPVARLRKKSGVSSADLRIALGGLVDKKLVRLAGIIVEAVGETGADIRRELAERANDPNTIPRATPDLVPPTVMDDIRSMLDEDD
jgi:hypothetical protein